MNGPRDDPFDLQRFTTAQEPIYDQALLEIRQGRKQSHWMWFVFPQLAGLGYSEMARRYAIRGIDEARAYIAHPILGSRLIECAEGVLRHGNLSPNAIFGSPDDMKLRSSATLFEAAASDHGVFEKLLRQCFDGERDEKTLARLQSET